MNKIDALGALQPARFRYLVRIGLEKRARLHEGFSSDLEIVLQETARLVGKRSRRDFGAILPSSPASLGDFVRVMEDTHIPNLCVGSALRAILPLKLTFSDTDVVTPTEVGDTPTRCSRSTLQVAGRIFSIPTVKDVPGRCVNHVVGLDTEPGFNGPPHQFLL